MNPNTSQRGAVLALVLFVLTALTVLAVGFSRDILLDHALSVGTRSVLSAQLLLDSGKRLATSVLVYNSLKGDPDHLNEEWSHFDLYLEAFTARSSLSGFSGKLVDENSRFPLTSLFYTKERDKTRALIYGQIFVRMVANLMRKHGYSGSTSDATLLAESWLKSLLEWGGQLPLEDESRKWYLSRRPACLPPRRPPLGPEEFLLIRWPNMEPNLARRLILGTESLPGIIDLITIWAPGPVNINTASPFILAALGEDLRGEAFASELVRQRQDPDAARKEDWYIQTALRHGIRLDEYPREVLDVRSRWYRLELAISQGGGERKGFAVGWVTNSAVTWEYQSVR